MKIIGKNTITGLLGLAGGLASWPFLELVLWKQGAFPSYLLFFLTATVIPGLFIAMFLGASEGVIGRNWSRAVKGALIGLVSGTIGGLVGGLSGQILLSRILVWFPGRGDVLETAARTLAWALVGIFIGLSDGIRSVSLRKIGVGALGGMVGGSLGGFLLEMLSRSFASSIPRLAGLVLMGLMIGVFYSLLDRKYSFGVLRVLNGSQAGKKYRINQKKMDLGSGNRTIIFNDYEGVDDKEIELRVDRGQITVIDDKMNSKLFVNDKATIKTTLKYGDVIKAGTVKMLLEAE
ncbi:MAG: hypothetical protein JXR86_08580 [Spirochaetales bacterium]|nr:hypothetical protein [Spirochaetales bacterium]